MHIRLVCAKFPRNPRGLSKRTLFRVFLKGSSGFYLSTFRKDPACLIVRLSSAPEYGVESVLSLLLWNAIIKLQSITTVDYGKKEAMPKTWPTTLDYNTLAPVLQWFMYGRQPRAGAPFAAPIDNASAFFGYIRSCARRFTGNLINPVRMSPGQGLYRAMPFFRLIYWR